MKVDLCSREMKKEPERASCVSESEQTILVMLSVMQTAENKLNVSLYLIVCTHIFLNSYEYLMHPI